MVMGSEVAISTASQKPCGYGLHLLDDPDQVGAVGEVAVFEHQERVALVGVLVEVIDPGGVVCEAGWRP
jgi:hypothetical protein